MKFGIPLFNKQFLLSKKRDWYEDEGRAGRWGNGHAGGAAYWHAHVKLKLSDCVALSQRRRLEWSLFGGVMEDFLQAAMSKIASLMEPNAISPKLSYANVHPHRLHDMHRLLHPLSLPPALSVAQSA